MKPLNVSLAGLGLLFLCPAGASAAEPLTPVERFLGVNQCADWDGMRAMGLGWARSHIEPNNGWGTGPDQPALSDFSPFDAAVTAAADRGVTLLPILGYIMPWAALTEDYEFQHGGHLYHVEVLKDESRDGGYTRTRVRLDPVARIVLDRMDLNASTASPRRDVWERYVEALVARYSQPPYNIRYWQVWNEGTMEAGSFWDENIENYVLNVHIPAAAIIRKYGGRVVWGGWPDSNSLEEYDATLRCRDAWRYTDILDVHYRSPVAFDYLYSRWVSGGKCKGIWMTEVGFTENLDVVASTYPRMLYWALTHRFDDPDKYKVFWFGWDNPADAAPASRCNLTSGGTPTPHGLQVAQFARLLRGPKLDAFSGFRTEPGISFSLNEREASVEGFRCDGRLVFAFHIPITSSGQWIDWRSGDSRHMGVAPGSRIALTLKGISAAGLKARVEPLPGADPYDAAVRPDGKDAVVDIVLPIQPGQSALRPMGTEAIFYVAVE